MDKSLILKYAKQDLDTAIELIYILEEDFQKKLTLLKKKAETASNKNKQKLVAEAKNLYLEYNESLTIIEDFIDQYNLAIKSLIMKNP
ncbi:MAG: hypothetical protein A2857_04765 [Candidatus Levybacteria bacterium RIFCSPHIGHO2_01_FULL_36_15]|nr:MAG: hypothetical protein A2857_04765 [Candidatus Levybacteria bacterium RIFCSPHIGHO2_01_FULL_36_15]